MKTLAGEPTRVIGGQEDRDRGDIARLPDPTKRRRGYEALLDIRADKTRSVRPLGFHDARVDGVDADLLRGEFLPALPG